MSLVLAVVVVMFLVLEVVVVVLLVLVEEKVVLLVLEEVVVVPLVLVEEIVVLLILVEEEVVLWLVVVIEGGIHLDIWWRATTIINLYNICIFGTGKIISHLLFIHIIVNPLAEARSCKTIMF